MMLASGVAFVIWSRRTGALSPAAAAPLAEALAALPLAAGLPTLIGRLWRVRSRRLVGLWAPATFVAVVFALGPFRGSSPSLSGAGRRFPASDYPKRDGPTNMAGPYSAGTSGLPSCDRSRNRH